MKASRHRAHKDLRKESFGQVSRALRIRKVEPNEQQKRFVMRLQNASRPQGADDSVADHAAQVTRLTAAAWNVRRSSPRAVAREAPRGYVPVRVRRRIQLAHSW